MKVLKRRKQEYPLYEPAPKVLKRRSHLSVVPKKEVFVPEVVNPASLASPSDPFLSVSEATLALTKAKKLIRHHKLIKSFAKDSGLVEIPYFLRAPFPFSITSNARKRNIPTLPTILDYGVCKLEIKGVELSIKELDVMLILFKLRENWIEWAELNDITDYEYYEKDMIITKLPIIAKGMGSKYPHAEATKKSIMNRLSNMRAVSFTMDNFFLPHEGAKKPELENVGLGLIHNYFLYGKDQGNMLVIFFDSVLTQMLERSWGNDIDLDYYFSLKMDAARAAYYFLSRQKNQINTKGHSYMSNEKVFCKNIGLHYNERDPWQTRKVIYKLLDELKDESKPKKPFLYSDEYNKGTDWKIHFIFYKNPKKPKAIEDMNPKMTKAITEAYKRRIGKVDDKKIFILAAKKEKTFMGKLIKQRLIDAVFIRTNRQRAELMINAELQSVKNPSDIKPHYLCSDYFFDDVYPRYLKDQAVLEGTIR